MLFGYLLRLHFIDSIVQKHNQHFSWKKNLSWKIAVPMILNKQTNKKKQASFPLCKVVSPKILCSGLTPSALNNKQDYFYLACNVLIHKNCIFLTSGAALIRSVIISNATAKFFDSMKRN